MSSKTCRIVLLIGLLVCGVSVASAGAPASLVFFGDSLTDAGNHFIAFSTTAQAPYAAIPDDSYAIGGHHFSNGNTWPELLAASLGVPTAGSPALRKPGVFTNYSVGRARARAGAPAFPEYDLLSQTGRFLADFGGVAPVSVRYVIAIGANDVHDALSALEQDPSGVTSGAIVSDAVTAVAQAIWQLWAAGARKFVVVHAPDLAQTPVVRSLDPLLQAITSQLVLAYNGGLDQALGQLAGLPGLDVVVFDTGVLMAQVMASPESVGLDNVDNPCLTFGVVGGAVCDQPDRYLFWDGIHPTTAGHAIIAGAMASVLSAP